MTLQVGLETTPMGLSLLNATFGYPYDAERWGAVAHQSDHPQRDLLCNVHRRVMPSAIQKSLMKVREKKTSVALQG